MHKMKAVALTVCLAVAGTDANAQFPSGAEARPVAQTTYAHDVSIDLQSCNSTGTILTCRLLLTSGEGEVKFSLYRGWQFGAAKRGTRMLDQAGNEYFAQSIRIGNQNSTGVDQETTLFEGKPVPVSVRFVGVPTSINEIGLLAVEFRHGTLGSGHAEFRAVPISRR